MIKPVPAFICIAALSACASPPAEKAAAVEPAPVVAPTPGCPVLASRNWQATLNKPADGPAELTLTGEVDLPTPGYTVQFSQGITDRAMPPSQQIIAAFTPPSGMVMQVVTAHQLKYILPNALPHYRSLRVRCGDTVIVTLTEIQGQ
jgi:hypothetical protein